MTDSQKWYPFSEDFLEKDMLGEKQTVFCEELTDKRKKVSATTTVDFETKLVLDRGHGVFIRDMDGNWYLCFTSGVGVMNLGYNNPWIENPTIEQLKSGMPHAMHQDDTSYVALRYEEKLSRFVPVKNMPGKVFLCNSGTEANEAAIKLLWDLRPERPYMASLEGSFAGRTLGSLHFATKEVHRRNYPLANSVKIPFSSETAGFYKNQFIVFLENFFEKKNINPKKINGLHLELVQIEGGVRVLSERIVLALKEFCENHDIAIIVDEVQTGFGRTGKLFATEHYPFLSPDIITLAKGIANGLPMGACVFRNDWDYTESGRHSNTFGGNAVAAARALAVLSEFERRPILRNVELRELELRLKLPELRKKFPAIIKDVRGKGLVWAMEFCSKDKAMNFKRAVKKKGVRVLECGAESVRIMPPLIISQQDLAMGFALIEETLMDLGSVS